MNINQTVIFYFSGTGNTLKLAHVAQRLFDDMQVISILKQIPAPSDASEQKQAIHQLIANSDLLVFLAPVYALDMPRIMRNFINELPAADPSKSQRAFVIANGGDWDDAGWAVTRQAATLRSKGYNVPIADVIMMPNNWIPMMDAPQGEEARRIRAEGETYLINLLTKSIKEDYVYEKPFNTHNYGPIGSPLLHGLFHKAGLRFLWKRFKVTDKCTSCGLCAKHCPTKAIEMISGKPKWHKTCEQCVRCMNLCPVRAIQQLEVIGKGSTREAYLEPGLKRSL